MLNKKSIADFSSEVTRRSVLKEYKRGQVIAEAGDDNIAIRTVSSGVAGLYVDDLSGREILFAPVFRGTTINVMDIYFGRTINSCRALTRCNVHVLSGQEARELLAERSFIEWAFANMAKNVKSLIYFTTAMRNDSLLRRIEIFIDLVYWNQHGRPPQGSHEVELPISQRHLAEMMNVSRPYLNSRLRMLEENGKMRFNGKHVQVFNQK
jgi:CRP-like cAMP-binding protein